MRRKPRGFVRIAILHLLQESPMHGYRIMKTLEARSDGYYSASPGTIYPALQELLKREFITVKTISDKKTYVINEQGQAKLRAFKEKRPDDFWDNWKERWIWQSSDEARKLYSALDVWEAELRQAIRQARKQPDTTKHLINFIEDITKNLSKIMNR